MFSNKITFILCALILCVPKSPLYSQDRFTQDSIQIEKAAKKHLVSQEELPNKKEIQKSLSKNLENPSPKTDDFIQFYMAKLFLLKQQLKVAKEIAMKSIQDDFNESHSDAKFHNLLGVIYSSEKKYHTAIESFLKSVELYKKQGNKIKEHSAYNNIANIYLAIGDHESAYQYSFKCYEEFQHHPETPNYVGILGVLAICENNLNMLDSSSLHIETGFQVLKNKTDIVGNILINYAKAELEFKKGNYHKAIPFARESLTKSQKYKLSQYEIISSIVLMNIHNQLKEHKLALNYGKSALDQLQKTNNLSLQHSISDGISTANAGIGNFEKAYFFKNKSDSLKSIDRQEKSKKNIDKLMLEFQSVQDQNIILKQEQIITAQNHDIELSENRQIFVGIVAIILIVLVGLLIVFYKQRLKITKRNIQLDIANAVEASEEKERARISSELHDGLAAELTALKLSLEHQGANEESLEMLKNAHQLTRRVSHNLSPFVLEKHGLVEALRYFIRINNQNNLLHFYSNLNGKKLELPSKVQTILFRSMQELIQNAIKHAEANQIEVQILQNNKRITLSVEDDGVGSTSAKMLGSIGLGALRKRIELIRGKFEIETSINQGTTVFIHLNIKK